MYKKRKKLSKREHDKMVRKALDLLTKANANIPKERTFRKKDDIWKN